MKFGFHGELLVELNWLTKWRKSCFHTDHDFKDNGLETITKFSATNDDNWIQSASKVNQLGGNQSGSEKLLNSQYKRRPNCSQCFAENVSVFLSLHPCHHRFCYKCFISALKSVQSEFMTCGTMGCKQRIPDEYLRNLLSEDQCATFHKQCEENCAKALFNKESKANGNPKVQTKDRQSIQILLQILHLQPASRDVYQADETKLNCTARK